MSFPDPTLHVPETREQILLQEARRFALNFYWSVKLEAIVDRVTGRRSPLYRIQVVRDGIEIVSFNLPGDLDPFLIQHIVDAHNATIDPGKLASLPPGAPLELLEALVKGAAQVAPSQPTETQPASEEEDDDTFIDVRGLWR